MERGEFAQKVAEKDFAKLSFHVAAQILEYEKYGIKVSGADANQFKINFFERVEKDTGSRREKRKRTNKSGNQHGTAYYNNIRAGNASDVFVKAIYFWFHFFAETDAYGAAIDRALFGKVVFTKITDAEMDISAERKPTSSDVEGSLQPLLQFPRARILAPDRSNWLDPNVTDSIQFVGRKAERAALDAFAESPAPFLIWAVSGPSGAGKTRLVTQWIREFAGEGEVGADWNIGFLTAQTSATWKELGGDWAKWVPNRPTLIVIDYLHLFMEESLRWCGISEILK